MANDKRKTYGVLCKMLKNKVLFYIVSRYFTYFLQFINSLFIAVYLGPMYLGIWGFISLMIQYLTQINFGISHSVNAIISVNKNRERYVSEIVGESVWMLFGLSFFIGMLFLLNEVMNFNIGLRYEFYKFSFFIYLIVVIGYFNSLFLNVFRVYGSIREVIFNQSVFPVLMLIALFFFKGNDLLWALVISNLTAFALSLGVFLFRLPIKIEIRFKFNHLKEIQKRGWSLFVYNTSFYLIIISTRFFVSGYYSVKEFGFFTFAFSLANAILLLLESLAFLVFPKLLNRFSTMNNETADALINKVRDVYITLSHGLIHTAIFLFPFLLYFFPKYQEAFTAFRISALAIVLYTNSFGYQGLLISRGHEKLLGWVAFIALLGNVIISYLLVNYFKVSFAFVILSTMLTYVLYVFVISGLGQKEMGLRLHFKSLLGSVFPLRILIPYSVSLFIIFSIKSSIFGVIPVVIFLLLNYKVLLGLKEVALIVFKNPKVVDI